ncbi:hypothetical protein PVL29_020268 [Vitis rotundifolia]|uniref:Uncharacterized protein n=1 Tax=Vitis rotundifolia TaxID=103349 RepID=A0AA39DDU5_VITRO|nr:hypothetical protein PVL29_020268 [Vitis rotundifolia]
MLSSSKIKPLKTWIRLRSQSLSVKNRLIWEVVQEEQVDTIDRNDESTVDDIEENPTVENDGLEQQQEQATSELPTETRLKRFTKERQLSKKYTSDEYLLLSDGEELENYQEVLVMHEEMKSLHKNNTYELMELPKGKKTLNIK